MFRAAAFLHILGVCLSPVLSQNVLFELELPGQTADGVVEIDGKVYILNGHNIQSVGGELSENQGTNITELTLDGRILRTAQLGGIGDRSSILAPGPSGGTILAMSKSGRVVDSTGIKNIQISDFSQLWNDDRMRLSDRRCPPTVTSDGSTIAAVRHSDYGVSMTLMDGTPKWQVKDVRITSCAILSTDESKVFVVDELNNLDFPVKAISTATGEIVDDSSDAEFPIGSSFGGPALSPDGSTLYQYRTRGGLHVFDASNLAGGLQSIDQSSTNTASNVNPILSPDGTLVYVGGHIGSPFYCYDISSGDAVVVWVWRDLEPIITPILSDDGSMLFVATEDRILGIDALIGTTQFQVDHKGIFPSQFFLNEANNRLYASGTAGVEQGYVFSIEVMGGTVSPFPTLSPSAAPTFTMPPSASPTAAHTPSPTPDGSKASRHTMVGVWVASLLLFISYSVL